MPGGHNSEDEVPLLVSAGSHTARMGDRWRCHRAEPGFQVLLKNKAERDVPSGTLAKRLGRADYFYERRITTADGPQKEKKTPDYLVGIIG